MAGQPHARLGLGLGRSLRPCSGLLLCGDLRGCRALSGRARLPWVHAPCVSCSRGQTTACNLPGGPALVDALHRSAVQNNTYIPLSSGLPPFPACAPNAGRSPPGEAAQPQGKGAQEQRARPGGCGHAPGCQGSARSHRDGNAGHQDAAAAHPAWLQRQQRGRQRRLSRHPGARRRPGSRQRERIAYQRAEARARHPVAPQRRGHQRQRARRRRQGHGAAGELFCGGGGGGGAPRLSGGGVCQRCMRTACCSKPRGMEC